MENLGKLICGLPTKNVKRPTADIFKDKQPDFRYQILVEPLISKRKSSKSKGK